MKVEEELWNFRVEAAKKPQDLDDTEPQHGVEEARTGTSTEELQEQLNAKTAELKNMAKLLRLCRKYKEALEYGIQDLRHENADLKAENEFLEYGSGDGRHTYCSCCSEEMKRLRTELETLASTNIDMLEGKLKRYQDQLKYMDKMDKAYTKAHDRRGTLHEWLSSEYPDKVETLKEMVKSFLQDFGTNPVIGRSLLVGVRLREKLENFQKLWQEVLDFHMDDPAEPKTSINGLTQTSYYTNRYKESKKFHRRMHKEARNLGLMDNLKDSDGTMLVSEFEEYDKIRHKIDQGVLKEFASHLRGWGDKY